MMSSSSLKAKIIERMALKNLSIAELERRAGLTIHSVRNILKDRIKKPNIHSLQAIAEALDCSLMDLVGPIISTSTRDIPFPHRPTKVSPPVKSPELMLACTKTVLDLMGEHDAKASVDDFMDIIRKVYIYSSKGNSHTVDMRFAEWLIETQLGYSRAV